MIAGLMTCMNVLLRQITDTMSSFVTILAAIFKQTEATTIRKRVI